MNKIITSDVLPEDFCDVVYKVPSIFPHTRSYLENLIETCDTAINKVANGNLNVRKDGGFTIRYCDKDGIVKRKYIVRSNRNFGVYLKKYCAKRIIKVLKKPGNKFDNLDVEFMRLEQMFGDDVPDFCKSRNRILEEWQAEPYERNKFHAAENHIHQTKRGEFASSKIECKVADELLLMGIPYKLEMPVKAGNRTVYPDFVIIDPRTGCIYFIEVCGMMDDKNYVKNLLIKINDYAKSDIISGNQLILFFESLEVPINIFTIKATLNKILEIK